MNTKGWASSIVFPDILMVKQVTLLPFRLYCLFELMAWDSLAMLSYSRNEWVHREIRNYRGGPPPPPPLPDFITCSPILLVCSHKHDTKPEALLFIVHRGRLALSWMGWIRYVLPACQLSVCPTVRLCCRGPTWQPGPLALHGPGIVYTSNLLASLYCQHIPWWNTLATVRGALWIYSGLIQH